MLKNLNLAIRVLRQDLRSGQWIIIFFALLLAVTSITGLNFYTDRLIRGLTLQSTKLLGGDLVISSPNPISPLWIQKAHDLQLNTAEIWLYPSVIKANQRFQLINIQAVSSHYPLLSDTPLSLNQRSILVEPRLLSLLSLKLGDTLTIGALSLQIQGILPTDMDMLNTGLVIAPRILMRLDDVAATKTVIPGSRVDYRLLITGKPQALNTYRSWIVPQLIAGQRLLDLNNQRFTLRDALIQAENYIQLVLLLGLLMSGVAIALSTRQYLNRHYAYIALWRCLGARKNQILLVFLWQLIILAMLAGLLGTLFGYALQTLIANLFNDFLRFPLPTTSLAPILLGLVTSTLLLFSYAYPLLSELPRTSPLYIWRNESSVTTWQKNSYMFIAFAFLFAYIYWALQYSLLALFIVDALLLSIGFLYALSIISLSVMRKVLDISRGVVRRGLSQLIQHPESTSIQLTAFTLILMSLLILSNVQNSLLQDWQRSLPSSTPNYFAFNISAGDLPEMQQLFNREGVKQEGIYPMVRGRLIELNNQPIMTVIHPNSRYHNSLHRELNLSATINYPSDNRIVQGTAWNENHKEKSLLSVEKEMADSLGLKLGDKLTFQIGEEKISGVISNIRTVNWQSFHPNFYVIFTPHALDDFSATYITSFYLSANKNTLLNQLTQQFPNITIIDVAALLQQLQDLLAKMTLALQYLFSFALGASILIFIISLLSSMDERKRTYRLLRILGASKKYIYGSMAVEFSLLFTLAIIVSILLAKGITYLLMKTLFNA